METTKEDIKRILIIDDEPDLSQMVKFQFKARGFEVETAGDGIQGLEKLKTFTPDLIILDVNMPRMGGIEFYNKICGANNKPRFPVLMLTARSNIKEMFKQFDIDGFIVKPFEIDGLVQEAEMIIKKRMRMTKKGKDGEVRAPHKVCIVENNPEILRTLGSLFLDADYTVNPARSATSAIERMMADVPDVALVQLGLQDLAGDMLVLRLAQMSKTMDVKFVIYMHRSDKHAKPVLDKLGEKTGVIEVVEYDDPKELIAVVDRLL